LTGSNARVVFTRRARTVGDSVRTTFGREKNTERALSGDNFPLFIYYLARIKIYINCFRNLVWRSH